ncbi:MAG TPA: YdeI/OmpD-associated family protein [Candidatus Deferrimicrobium sp.]|nr:YdeI/OmpD-associated family protein [Candidatus Deferrimicrobium sp.]
MGALDTAPHVHPEDRAAWRRWLEANHATASGVWFVDWRRSSGRARLGYEAAIEEALCFGWVDAQGARLDEQRSKLYFAPRKPRSPWARTNKARVERLLQDGRMAPAGLAAVERAKADGSWAILDSVDRLEVPADLAAALAERPPARANFDAFPPSVRHGLLGWIALARRAETRERRVVTTAAAAERNERSPERPMSASASGRT